MTWLSWFPDTAWKGAVLLSAAWLAARALRRQPSALRHLVWVAALGGLLVMPVLSAAIPVRVSLPAVPVAAPPAPPVNESGTPTDRDSRDNVPPTARLVSDGSESLPVSDELPKASVLPAWSAGDWLVAVWLLGALAFGLRFAAASLAIRRLRSGPAPQDERLHRSLELAAAKVGLRSPPSLVISEDVSIPCAYGWLRPVVVLPPEARGWSCERVDVVLLHEATHIRRGDYVTHLVAEFARIIHWYNPLVWVASRSLRAEAERATDERVMNAGPTASDYADHLLDIVRGAGTRRVPVPLLPLAHRSEFEGRLIAIL